MTLTCLAAWIESALWDRHDARAVAAGFQVTRVGRWTRRYRHPRMTSALAAIAAGEADSAADRSERAA
jgi:hypothetical protein